MGSLHAKTCFVRPRRGPALGGPDALVSPFSRLKNPPYARTPSKAALPTALTQGLPRCTLKLSAQVHWPHWAALQVLSSGMLRTAVDDGVVDFGLFSCISCLAAWLEPIESGLQQLPAALWRGRSLA